MNRLDIFGALRVTHICSPTRNHSEEQSHDKPNLLRGAVYVLLRTPIYTVLFALAQRNIAPAETAIILYYQTNNPAPTPTPLAPGGATSQDFEAQLDNHDSFAADDFVVPAGQVWKRRCKCGTSFSRS